MSKTEIRSRRRERIFELNPSAAAVKKAARDRQLHAVALPRLRLAGVVILLVLMVTHGLFLSASPSWPAFAKVGASIVTYALVSWWLLHKWFGRTGQIGRAHV